MHTLLESWCVVFDALLAIALLIAIGYFLLYLNFCSACNFILHPIMQQSVCGRLTEDRRKKELFARLGRYQFLRFALYLDLDLHQPISIKHQAIESEGIFITNPCQVRAAIAEENPA